MVRTGSHRYLTLSSSFSVSITAGIRGTPRSAPPSTANAVYSLKQSLRIKGAAGEPLPQVWSSLGARLMRGSLNLICAAPNTGKSAFILSYALWAGTPTLYFSADSDHFMQLSRSLSILTEMTMDESERLIRSRDLDGYAEIINLPIQFDYRAAPTLEDISDTVNAWAQRDGEYPELVIIDNITNVRTDLNTEDPFTGLEVVMDELHVLARSTSACVVALHHVTGRYNDGDQPIPLSGIKGQIGRVPEMILTLHRVPSTFGPADTLRVSTVKNKYGAADPTGSSYASLEFVGRTMQIRDYRKD